MPEPPRRGRPPSPQTAHRQAAAWLRTQLAAKRWKVGEALPSLRQLAEQTGFAFGAMRRAAEQLKAERRIHASPRRRLVVTRMVDGPMDGRDTLLVVSSNPLSARTSIALDLLR
ncbi:MAG: GntR family transcriptional regulator, partial [Planctomycetota bacterium]|nr:GntR family transcriptional regulator [Planctomycetota bacterium]